jgi:hypothetical protein
MVVKFDTTVIEETPAVPETVSFRRRVADEGLLHPSAHRPGE